MASSARPIHRTSLLLLILAAGISILLGISLERGPHTGVMGFPGIYFGTKCLLQGCDPYDVRQLQHVYDAAGVATASKSTAIRQATTLYVNLPTTSLIVAPLALLPFRAAQALWLVVLILSFLFAAYLMWRSAADYASDLAVLLSFIVLTNCEIIFSGGNTAGLVTGLTVIATWCFLRHRFATAGIICLAVSLAIKPHDAGPIWLYFLIAGRIHTKRALQSAALAFGLGLIAFFWVSHAAPHWLPELRSNLATISAPGGINEPGPRSIGVNSPDMIVDLQTVISIFCDNPRVYNSVTYAICALLFCVWLVLVARTRSSLRDEWIALAAIAAISMLVTYHRSYDVKLVLLLSIPASAMLWAEGGVTSWIALIVSSLAALFSGDIPLTALTNFIDRNAPLTEGFFPKSQTAILTRPVPLILLGASIFYLFVLWNRARRENADATQ